MIPHLCSLPTLQLIETKLSLQIKWHPLGFVSAITSTPPRQILIQQQVPGPICRKHWEKSHRLDDIRVNSVQPIIAPAALNNCRQNPGLLKSGKVATGSMQFDELGFHLGRLKELTFLDSTTFPASQFVLQWLKFYRVHFPSVWSQLFMHCRKTHAQLWSTTFCKPLADTLVPRLNFLGGKKEDYEVQHSIKDI